MINLDELKYSEYLDKKDFRKRFLAGEQPPVTTVFHLGACSSTTETSAEYLNDNNLLYTQQLCEWSIANGTRFIYASSAATYGDGELGYSDSDELTPKLKPLNLYGKSKQDFDRSDKSGTAGYNYFHGVPFERFKGSRFRRAKVQRF